MHTRNSELDTHNGDQQIRAAGKAIAEVLRRAREEGFIVVELHEGHRWERLVCPACGEQMPVYCTPRVPEYHALRIDKFRARHHPRRGEHL